MITTKKIVLLTLLTGLLAPALRAQTYSIDWHKIAGGGGNSAGTNGSAVYALSGTIGQPDAGGSMTGGSYSLTGGFWSIVSIVHAASSPVLSIARSGNAGVVVSWPTAPAGFTLQQSTSLSTANWTTSGYAITTANGTNSITISHPSGNLFFRLGNP